MSQIIRLSQNEINCVSGGILGLQQRLEPEDYYQIAAAAGVGFVSWAAGLLHESFCGSDGKEWGYVCYGIDALKSTVVYGGCTLVGALIHNGHQHRD